MNQISLTPTESVAIGRLAKVLATKALEFVTSSTLTCVLAIMAAIALMVYNIGGEHAAWAVTLTVAFAVQLCAALTIDISKKGGEL